MASAQAANSGRNSPEEAAIRQVVARLTQQFPELSADDIDRAVNGQYDRFSSSPIRDFVPVLVERATRRQLTQHDGRREGDQDRGVFRSNLAWTDDQRGVEAARNGSANGLLIACAAAANRGEQHQFR